MGHTSWPARGNEFNNRDNHPIRAGIVIGASRFGHPTGDWDLIHG
jgi:hypothetical protein